jgi:hypothetical protein
LRKKSQGIHNPNCEANHVSNIFPTHQKFLAQK